MKKLMLSLLLSGVMLGSFAQQKNVKKSTDRDHEPKQKMEDLKGKSAEQIARLQTDRLDHRLKFTDKQRKEVYAIQLKEAKQMKNAFAKEESFRQAARKDRQQSHDKMMKVLSPEQQKMMHDSFAENRKDKRDVNSKDKQPRRSMLKNEVNERKG